MAYLIAALRAVSPDKVVLSSDAINFLMTSCWVAIKIASSKIFFDYTTKKSRHIDGINFLSEISFHNLVKLYCFGIKISLHVGYRESFYRLANLRIFHTLKTNFCPQLRRKLG